MKVLVVPDVHGSREWEIVKTFPQDSYDRIVFMGDYFDAWENKWPEQGENFEKICAFVRQDPERRKALLGNHDWSYLSARVHGAGCSGHQNGKVSKIKSLLLSARDILDLAFEADGGSILVDDNKETADLFEASGGYAFLFTGDWSEVLRKILTTFF